MIGVANISHAAFIIEASDASGRLGEGNFAYTGSVGVPSYSTASAGQLPATTDTKPDLTPAPTFFTLRHAYGGNGTADEYTFSYTPSVDGDNTSFAAGTLYNSLGAAPDLVSTGLSGGTAGIYNVYRIHPGAPGVSGGLTTYQVFVNGLELAGLGQSIDQNAANLTNGLNIGRWELIGSVPIANATDTVTVTMTPDSSTFVSMRASGIMFEYVEAIPEPSAALLGLAGLVLLYRRRVRA
jgi:hypothetical protein